ncbi:MAG: family 20 glycosylhydrolase [Bacteroidales bacterium]|nr:family 20 glycosylhydrolase [Bacteroidales bacterium]
MKNYANILIFIGLILIAGTVSSHSQNPERDDLPVRGFCIAAPSPDMVNKFIDFMEEELAPRRVNTLILRVDYNYEYESHPELVSENPLSEKDVKKLVKTAKKHQIRIIPQVNLLGHQSWHSTPSKLLEVYPEFDETPHVELPEKYEWPNEDGLYCKSYCPLHPGVHDVVFDIVDEICDVFDADAFHAGMDEVFYIGDENCPRCSGRDKSELFAGEVNKIRDHLYAQDRELWIWGDRLLDGETTGIGLWEASENDTHRAIDMISEDVFICDWHYERPDPTPVYFSMKGFRVAACPYKRVSVGIAHAENMIRFREQAASEMKDNFQGVIQTVWTSCGNFLKEFYSEDTDNEHSESACFKAMFNVVNAGL